MRRSNIIRTILAVVLLSSVPVVSRAQAQVVAEVIDKAVPDQVEDRKNLLQNAKHFAEQIKQSIESLTYMEDQLRAAWDMADGLRKAYSVYDALFVGGGTVTELYYEVEGAISDAEYIKESISRATSNGTFSLRDANTIIRTTEYTLKEILNLYNSLSRVLSGDVNLDIRSRIQLLNDLVEKIRMKRATMKEEFERKEKEAEAAIAVSTAELLMGAAYEDVDVSLPNGEKLRIPTAQEILKDMQKRKVDESTNKDISTTGVERATEQAVNDSIELINGSASGGALSPLGRFLLVAIGVLSLIFGLPTFLKVTSGEHQSKNALWKWIMGTLVMLGLVFLLDLIM